MLVVFPGALSNGCRSFSNEHAVETDDTHWIVEAKMDKEMASVDVREKRDAALRWANYVSADPKVGKRWRYLLVGGAA